MVWVCPDLLQVTETTHYDNSHKCNNFIKFIQSQHQNPLSLVAGFKNGPFDIEHVVPFLSFYKSTRRISLLDATG